MFDVAGCSKCHVIAGEGTKLGPDLTDVQQRYKGAKLLEQILAPSTQINKQYQTYSLLTTQGETITGLILLEESDAYHVLPNPLKPEEIRIVKKTHLETMEASSVSTMPTGLLMTLEKDEILDLLSFIEAGGNSNHANFRH